MAINLKNYTSDVPAIKSIGLIQQTLVAFGATDISMKYENSVCISIRFRLIVNGGPLFFELPAKVEKCFKVLWEDRVQKTEGRRQGVYEQAEKTAWKIVYDWILIQLSMIQLEQAEAVEILLPYIFNPQTEETFYNSLKRTGFKELGQ